MSRRAGRGIIVNNYYYLSNIYISGNAEISYLSLSLDSANECF